MKSIRGVLFDLDGTLLDTAPDLTYALNQLRQERYLPELPVSSIRSIANLGSKAMLKHAFEMDEKDPGYASLRNQFFSLYQKHILDSTQLFPNIEKVLSHLEQRDIPWGIVTNKLTKHANVLLSALGLSRRTDCIICGDTLAKSKPDPLPIIHACQMLNAKPKDCLYIGDAITDVIASKAAGTKSLVALYGYINHEDDPLTWKADGYVNEPIEIIEWLEQYQKN